MSSGIDVKRSWDVDRDEFNGAGLADMIESSPEKKAKRNAGSGGMRTDDQVFELSIGLSSSAASSSSSSSGLHNAHGLLDFGSSSSSLLEMGPPGLPEFERAERTLPGTPVEDRTVPRTPKSAESADVRMLITETLLSPVLHIQQSPTTSMARSGMAKIPSSKYVHAVNNQSLVTSSLIPPHPTPPHPSLLSVHHSLLLTITGTGDRVWDHH